MPTVTEATKRGPGNNGTHFWDVTLDDGREAWMLAVKDISVGEEVVVAEEKGRLRARRPPKEQDGSKGSGKSYEADPKKLRSENARSALHAAKDLVIGDEIPLDRLGEYTAKFYDFIENKAQVDD